MLILLVGAYDIYQVGRQWLWMWLCLFFEDPAGYTFFSQMCACVVFFVQFSFIDMQIHTLKNNFESTMTSTTFILYDSL